MGVCTHPFDSLLFVIRGSVFAHVSPYGGFFVTVFYFFWLIFSQYVGGGLFGLALPRPPRKVFTNYYIVYVDVIVGRTAILNTSQTISYASCVVAVGIGIRSSSYRVIKPSSSISRRILFLYH